MGISGLKNVIQVAFHSFCLLSTTFEALFTSVSIYIYIANNK